MESPLPPPTATCRGRHWPVGSVMQAARFPGSVPRNSGDSTVHGGKVPSCALQVILSHLSQLEKNNVRSSNCVALLVPSILNTLEYTCSMFSTSSWHTEYRQSHPPHPCFVEATSPQRESFDLLLLLHPDKLLRPFLPCLGYLGVDKFRATCYLEGSGVLWY